MNEIARNKRHDPHDAPSAACPPSISDDFLTADTRVLKREIWKDLEEGGATVDPRKGDFDDPIAGVVHIAFADGVEADVLLAR